MIVQEDKLANSAGNVSENNCTVKFTNPFKEARPVTFDEILDAVNRLTEQMTRIANKLDVVCCNLDTIARNG